MNSISCDTDVAHNAMTMFCPSPDSEDISQMKLANNCDLLDGQPCPPCRDYMAFETKFSVAQLDDLILQQSRIRSGMNQNHDLLTSIIPVEIVCSIFEHYVSATCGLDVFDEGEYQGPLLLGSICKTWRNIAWETGSLWTTFRLFLDRSNNSDGVTLSREWLERAGQLPLSISISDSHRRGPNLQESEALTRLIALINQRSKQWRNLDIIGPPWLLPKIKGAFGGASNLQALRTENTDDINTIQHSASFFLTYSKAQPSHLSLHKYHLNSIDIEWKHLTNVSLSQSTLYDSIDLLRRAAGVVCYKLSGITSQFPFPTPNAPIIYGALESLELDCPPRSPSQSRQIIKFFQHFLFPSLKHLKIKSGGKKELKDNRLLWDPVVAHIANSSPPLISFAIQYLGPNPFRTFIIPLLQLTPLLRHLAISIPTKEQYERWPNPWAEEHQFFRLLSNTNSITDDSTESTFLPSLQSIEFQVRHKFKKDADHFWTSIPCIFGPITHIHDTHRRPLKTLRVRVDVHLAKDSFEIESKDVVLELLWLQENGIVLDLKDKYEQKDVLEDSMELHGLGTSDGDSSATSELDE